MIICGLQEEPGRTKVWDESACKGCDDFVPKENGTCVFASSVNDNLDKVHPLFRDILKPFVCGFEDKKITKPYCEDCSVGNPDGSEYAKDMTVKIDSLNPPDDIQTC